MKINNPYGGFLVLGTRKKIIIPDNLIFFTKFQALSPLFLILRHFQGVIRHAKPCSNIPV
jgi:hypothetical protein